MTTSLTDRQSSILVKLVRFFEDLGRFPTLREIGALIGVTSTTAVTDHLRALARRGYLQSTGGGMTGAWRIARLPDGTPVVPRLIATGPRRAEERGVA